MHGEHLDEILGPLPPEELAVVEARKKVRARERDLMGESLAKATAEAIKPLVERVESAVEAIKAIEIKPPTIPEIKIPEIKVPEVKVPPVEVRIPKIEVPKPQVTVECQPPAVTVNVPPQEPQPAPVVNIPDTVEVRGLKGHLAPILGALGAVGEFLRGITRKNPVPVMLVAPGTDREQEPYFYKAQFIGGGASNNGNMSNVTEALDGIEAVLVAIQAGTDYLDDISVYSAQISANTGDIESILTNSLASASVANGAIADTNLIQVGGIAASSPSIVTDAKAYCFRMNKYGSQYVVQLDGNGKQWLTYKEGSDGITGSNSQASMSFVDASGRGLFPRNPVLLEDVAHASGDPGIMALARRIDTAASSAGSSGDYATLNQDANGHLYVTPGASAGAIGTSGVLDQDADGTAQTVKGSAGNLYGFSLHHTNTADHFLQLFNATSPTPGTTVPTYIFRIPKGDGTDRGELTVNFPTPLRFSTAITYCVTTTPTGSTSPTNDVIANFFYA